jgi:hydroxypyruvate isomerase
VDALVGAIQDSGVRLTGLNFFAGDLGGADCGALGVPELSSAFRENVAVVTGIAAELGTAAFNALYGNRDHRHDPSLQDAIAMENLAFAARAVEAVGGTVLIEPVSGPKPYPLRTAADAAAVVMAARSAGHANVALLLDLYHLAVNGDDVDAAIDKHAALTGHVQVADAPGRGEPGSGSLDLTEQLDLLRARGYAGRVALEYKPTTTTLESLANLALVAA